MDIIWEKMGHGVSSCGQSVQSVLRRFCHRSGTGWWSVGTEDKELDVGLQSLFTLCPCKPVLFVGGGTFVVV